MTTTLLEIGDRVGRAAEHAGLVRLVVLSRILDRLGYGSEPAGVAPAYPAWLEQYRAQLAGRQPASLAAGSAPAWWRAQLDEHEDELDGDNPLAHVDRTDAYVLVAAGLIEEDIRFGSLFAQLQEPLQSRRPCIGLLSWLLADAAEPVGDLSERCQRLVNRGLLSVENPSDPRAEWVVRLPVAVWDLLGRGEIRPDSLPGSLRFRPRTDFPALDQVVVGDALTRAVARLPALLREGNMTGVVVRGMVGSGRTTLLGAVARSLDLDLLVYEGPADGEPWRLLAALASIGSVLPVVKCAPSAGETAALPALTCVDRPLGVVIARAGGLTGPALEQAITIVLGPCAPADRRLLWHDSGLDARAEDFDEIVDRFLLTPGNIHRTVPLARAAAAADGRSRVRAGDVQTATRTLQRQSLETLATYLEPLTGQNAPILTATAEAELETLAMRCRHRERLQDATEWIQGGLNRGVRALFSGPSGTGKTLAARHLAARSHLDLYRVDLAGVVNKYIGETERNLDQVLSRAEELDVMLLLDEGDALMARRTDVGNANDRYANLETNFLLQRLETFDGIVIITTNAGNRIDTAFLRRIDVTVDFVPPDAERRWQIWSAHLPVDHAIDVTVLNDIARRCNLTGGQIRNAALHATLLSLDRDERMDADDLMAAVQREYRRTGASFPLVRNRPGPANGSRS